MIKAEYIKAISNDLMVVNAARVSMDKESHEFTYRADKEKGSDEGLLQYLNNANHWTPFSHVRFTLPMISLDFILDASQTDLAGAVWDRGIGNRPNYFRTSLWGWKNLINSDLLHPGDQRYAIATLKALAPECAKVFGFNEGPARDGSFDFNDPDFIDVTMRETLPIFIARQRFKHMVGFTYNEVSRRYVDDTPEFYYPDVWRSRPEGSIKQGSGGAHPNSQHWMDHYGDICDITRARYTHMVEDGVAPEQARALIPQSMLTSYYVTGSMTSWARAHAQRADTHAQLEIQGLAGQWDEIMRQPGMTMA